MAEPLTEKELRQLRAYGYKNEDIVLLDEETARTFIANKTRRPGSKQAAAAISAATGHPSVPHAYTDEGIAEQQEGKLIASAYVIRSDHEADLLSRQALRRMGSGVPIPTDEIAQPYVDANPDRAFRWMTKEHCSKRGTRGWQPVYDKNGKKVTHLNEGRWLAHKPKDVRDAQLREYQQAGERASQAARETMDNAVERIAGENSRTGTIRALDSNHPLFNR